MTQFVESCVETASDGAKEAARQSRGRPQASKLLKVLKGKKRILVTCHRHPDPDALGSGLSLAYLLGRKLPDAKIEMAVKGTLGGGINSAFTRHAKLNLVPWEDERLLDRERPDAFDAVVLCDVQPAFPYSPLPDGLEKLEVVFPTAIIDHHRARGRRPSAPFVDIRPDVGANASIIFSYFKELDVEVPPDIAATLLYAVESDLAGAAGEPSELDNVALSNLTLVADTKLLYRMRHVALPQHYFISYANALLNASLYENVLMTHLDLIEFLEKPAVIADFLLRFEGADWCVVTALVGKSNDGRPSRLLVSVRTNAPTLSAGEAMRRAMEGFGEGGGHRTKAGGFVRLENGTPTEIERVRLELRKRFLRALKLPEDARGRKLMTVECDENGQMKRFAYPGPRVPGD